MKRIPLEGQTIKGFEIISFEGMRDRGHAVYKMKCPACGNTKDMMIKHLRHGSTVSCGCVGRARARDRLKKYATSKVHRGRGNPAYKHGMTGTKFHMIWVGARNRCNCASSGSYKNYGAKGIKFEWPDFSSFYNDMHQSFLEHIEIRGEKQTTLERIDNTKNYNKHNCRWATYLEQARNRRKPNRRGIM